MYVAVCVSPGRGHVFAAVLIKADCVLTTWHSGHTVSPATFISQHYNSAASMLPGHSRSHCDWVNPAKMLDATLLG